MARLSRITGESPQQERARIDRTHAAAKARENLAALPALVRSGRAVDCDDRYN